MCRNCLKHIRKHKVNENHKNFILKYQNKKNLSVCICFISFLSVSLLFLLILLFYHNEWQMVLNSVNFILFQLKRINIFDNKEHLKCPWGLKPGEKTWLKSQRDWWQWQWQQEQWWSSEGSGSGSTPCPQMNTLDLWESSGCLCCK